MVLRVIAVLLFVAAIFFGIKYVVDLRDANKALEASNTEKDDIADGTGAVVEATSSAMADAQRVDVVVTQARNDYARSYEVLKDENEDVRAWAAGTIPVSVRELARARRLARDGPRSDAAGSAGVGSAEGTTGDDSQP